jgi:hypothetical protein
MRGKRLAIKIFIYVAFVAWLGGVVFLIGYRIRHPINDSYDAQRDQRQTEYYVVGVQETNAKPNGKESGDHQNYAAKWTEPIVILTALLVGIAAIAAYVYYGQLKEMRKTVAKVGEQGETMKGQLTAMEGTLSAIEQQEVQMRRQADIMGNSLVITSKAYVGIHSVELHRIKETIFLKIENVGHVAADHIKIVVDTFTSVPPEFVDEAKQVRTQTRHRIERDFGETKLFRGNLQIVVAVHLWEYLSREEIRLTGDSTANATLAVRGYIEYTDAFLNQPLQRTDFFFTYEPGDECWSTNAPEQYASLLITPETGHLKLTGFPVTMIHRKATGEVVVPNSETKGGEKAN